MKLTSLLALGGALCITSHAAHAAPRLAPSTICAPDTNGVDLIEMFARVPDYVFRYFGSAANNRLKLLDGKGVIFDKANGYIEIPYEGRSNHPDRDKVYALEMRAFRDSTGKPVFVVSGGVKWQTKVKPFIHVFRFDKDGYPYRTTAKDFPYPLYFENEGDGKMPYDYILKNNDNIIRSALPESDGIGYSYRWTGKRFTRFVEKGGNY